MTEKPNFKKAFQEKIRRSNFFIPDSKKMGRPNAERSKNRRTSQKSRHRGKEYRSFLCDRTRAGDHFLRVDEDSSFF